MENTQETEAFFNRIDLHFSRGFAMDGVEYKQMYPSVETENAMLFQFSILGEVSNFKVKADGFTPPEHWISVLLVAIDKRMSQLKQNDNTEAEILSDIVVVLEYLLDRVDPEYYQLTDPDTEREAMARLVSRVKAQVANE